MNIKLIAVPALALAAGLGLAACGSGGSSSSGTSSSGGNSAACSAYWVMLNDVNNNDYTDAAGTDLTALEGTQSGITNSTLSSAVSTFTANMTPSGDSATGSSASYVIGGTCTGLGYSNPNG